jgi:hypothetical protein
MLENRIGHLFRETVAAPAGSDHVGFVACPLPLFAAFTAAQQSFVAEVYRRAQELTAAQLRKPVRKTIPEFSRN